MLFQDEQYHLNDRYTCILLMVKLPSFSYLLQVSLKPTLPRMIINFVNTKGSVTIGGMSTVLLIDTEIPDSFLFGLTEFETTILEISGEYEILGFFVLWEEFSFSEICYQFLIDQHSFDFYGHRLEVNKRAIILLNHSIIWILFFLGKFSIGNKMEIEILFIERRLYFPEFFVSFHSQENIRRFTSDKYKLFWIRILSYKSPSLTTEISYRYTLVRVHSIKSEI